MQITITPEHYDEYISRAQYSRKDSWYNNSCFCAFRIALEPLLLEDFPDFAVGGTAVYANLASVEAPNSYDTLFLLPLEAKKLMVKMDNSLYNVQFNSVEYREEVRNQLPQTFELEEAYGWLNR